MIGIEAIVACIMSIDKDDPPRRAGSGGTGRVEPDLLTPPLLLCKKVADVYCVWRKRRLQSSCLVLIQKAPFCLLTDVSANRPSISLLGGIKRAEERRELQNIIILNGDAT